MRLNHVAQSSRTHPKLKAKWTLEGRRLSIFQPISSAYYIFNSSDLSRGLFSFLPVRNMYIRILRLAFACPSEPLSLSHQDLNIGARNIIVYVDGCLIFAGELQKGCLAHDSDGNGCTSIDLPTNLPLPPKGKIDKNWASADPREELDKLLLFNWKPSTKENYLEEKERTGDSDLQLNSNSSSFISLETARCISPEDDSSLSEKTEEHFQLASFTSPSILTSPETKQEMQVSCGKQKLPPLGLQVQLPSESIKRGCLRISDGDPHLFPTEEQQPSSEAPEAGERPSEETQESIPDLDFLKPLLYKHSGSTELLPPDQDLREEEEFSHPFYTENAALDKGKSWCPLVRFSQIF